MKHPAPDSQITRRRFLGRSSQALAAMPWIGASSLGAADGAATPRDDGYRGIWFTLGQHSEFGDKYSGGLGTYTANHVPMAVYARTVDKTFFETESASHGQTGEG